LGYDAEEARRYPWVMKLTGAPPRDKLAGAPPRDPAAARDSSQEALS
ncbi:MAG TPA: fatty acid hydroxylase family protein, partial [Acidocella sp.]|nr:fatty acid hydroxylase family protein [Acidocella sp.]